MLTCTDAMFQALEDEGNTSGTLEIETIDSPAGKKTPGAVKKTKSKSEGSLSFYVLIICFKVQKNVKREGERLKHLRR